MDRAAGYRQFRARAPASAALRAYPFARRGFQSAIHLCRSCAGRAGVRANRRQRGEIFAAGLADHRPRQAATTSGSGLGLWIAKAFVTANGGKLEAASAGADQGTTVSIHLPFATPASQPEVGPDD